jgi:hypothetical protein
MEGEEQNESLKSRSQKQKIGGEPLKKKQGLAQSRRLKIKKVAKKSAMGEQDGAEQTREEGAACF